MTIYSNAPAVRLAIADCMPRITAPLVRPVPLPPEVPGRMYHAGQVTERGVSIVLTVTERGHWWRTDDPWTGGQCAPCRGCGAPSAKADESGRCPHAPQAQDIASALLGRTGVAA